MPKGARHLASSIDCKNQALKVGSCAYGLQFHVEVTKDIIQDWIDKDFKDKGGRLTKKGQGIIKKYPKIKDRFRQNAYILYRNFEEIMSARKVLV